MGKIICVSNQKGGVGKTTVTFNLAKILSENARVLAIDNDHQGNLTSSLLDDSVQLTGDVLNLYREQPVASQRITDNLHLLGSSLDLATVADLGWEVIYRLREGLANIKDHYEYIVIDCHPDFGFLFMAALVASDYILIPTKPAPYALRGLTVLLDTVAKAKRRLNPNLQVLGIVLNLVERTSIAGDIEGVLRDTYREQVFRTVLGKAVKIEESPAFQKAITEYEPGSKPADQFRAMTAEFLIRMGGAS